MAQDHGPQFAGYIALVRVLGAAIVTSGARRRTLLSSYRY